MTAPRGLPATRVGDFSEEDAGVSSHRRIALALQSLGDRYRIERKLGEGAMGQVYLAEHILMRKRVAIKVLHAGVGHKPDAVLRFEREAIAASHVEHPNIVTAKDFGQLADGSFFLVLEYIDGIVLRSAMNQYGALPPKRALHIAAQICSGLVRAHELGIVHRDLKPENVMLVSRGDDPDFVKILDFGIARVPLDTFSSARDSEEPLTCRGIVQGTPAYMAPEQAMGHELDGRADLYALGILLYEMLTGTRPFVAKTDLLLLMMHVTTAVPSMAERAPHVHVDPRIEAFVRTLLSKEPDDRPRDAHVVEAALRELADAFGHPSLRSGTFVLSSEVPQRRASPPFWKRRTLWALLAPLLLVVVVLSVSFLRDSGASGEAPPAPILSGVTNAEARVPLQSSLAEARAHFERCEVTEGHAILERIQSRFDAPTLQQTIATACFSHGRAKEGLAALGLLAKENPDLALTPVFLANVEQAAPLAATMDASYAFLEANPTSAVADILYRLTLTPPVRSSMARAEKALGVPAMRARASRPLAIALALKEAGQGCEAVPYLGEAERFGDGRALAYLELLEPLARARTYRKVAGKRDLVSSEPYACLDKGGQLTRAITAIKVRLAR